MRFAAGAEVPPTGFQRAGLLRVHRAHLARFRHAMNLVGPGPLDEHYDDARAALGVLDEVEGLGTAWVDLGTGAGFPGVVLASLHPEWTVDLVDARRKRCVFLEGVVDEARAEGVAVHEARIEDLPEATWDGVVARALAPPDQVLYLAERLLRTDGRVVLFLQGHADPPEVPAFALEALHPYALGDKARQSAVLRRL